MSSEPTSPADDGATPLALRLEFERFSQQLIGLARKHIGARLEHKVDPEDVVQSAYKSLLLRYGEGGPNGEGWQGVREPDDQGTFHG